MRLLLCYQWSASNGNTGFGHMMMTVNADKLDTAAALDAVRIATHDLETKNPGNRYSLVILNIIKLEEEVQ